MTLHNMSLNPEPFDLIKSGKKTIEIRLFDEKRQRVHPNDTIVFTKLTSKEEKIAVEVIGISIFSSFKDLLLNFDKVKFGHPTDMKLEDQVKRQYEHYTEEEEKKYRVVGIHIKLLNKS
jgi:ASC-1-like (ASCH) protein